MKNYTKLVLILLLSVSVTSQHRIPLEPENCTTNLNPDPLSDKYKVYLSWLEQEYDLPQGLLFAVMIKESSGDPNAVSAAGAEGLFQFMPKTSKWLQIDPFSPYQAASGAARYLDYLINHFDGSLELGLAAYNAGMGNVKKYGNTVPPFQETQQYIVYVTDKIKS
jgi:soluble lytic murein transglycosylase-like protein